MRTLRLLVIASSLLLVLASCRPGDTAAWVRLYREHPRLAMHHLRVEHPAIWARAHPTQWRPDTVCAQWAQTALDAGFSQSEWYEPVARIMWSESRCSPSAYNPNWHFGGHASGLMQVIWPTWAAECGWGDIFEPSFNLRCAEYLAHTYGWSQWSTY